MIYLMIQVARGFKKAMTKGHIDLEKLNENTNCKFLAVADVELTSLKTAGVVLKHPSVINSSKNMVRGGTGQNKRIFTAVETEEGDILFLLFHPKGLDEICADDDAAGLFEGASFDKGFATDRGMTALTSKNTIVKKGSHENVYTSTFGKAPSEHTYIFEPHSAAVNEKNESFELKFVVDGNHKHSEENRAAAEAWIESTVLKKEHDSSKTSAEVTHKTKESEEAPKVEEAQ